MTMDGLYYAASHGAYPVSRDSTVVLGYRNDVVEISTFVGRLLATCQGCRTIEEHATRAWLAGVTTDPKALADGFDALLAAQLLRPWDGDRACLPRSRASTSPSRATKLTSVAIVTADRPAILRRCLNQVTLHGARFGHILRCFVIDGSRSNDARAATKHAVLGHAHSTHTVSYVGPEEAASLRASLEARGISRRAAADVASFDGVGASRNLALLLTAGQRVLMVDDDVVFDPWAPAEIDDGLDVVGHADPREWAFFSTRDEARRAAPSKDVDLFSAHDEPLGADLRELVSASARSHFGAACRHLVAALVDQQETSVRATFAGLAGDSGTNCPSALLFSAGPLRARLLASRTVFATALDSREVHRIAMRRTVTHDPACMAYSMALSNEALVPPFLPSGRNEDGIFGVMLSLIDPGGLFVHLPYGVYHESDRPSAYGVDRLSMATETRVADLILHLIRTRGGAALAGSAADRLRALGMMFLGLGDLKGSELLQLVKEAVLGTQCQYIARLDAELTAKPESPDYYREALGEYRQAFLAAARDPEYFLPAECRREDGLAKGCARLGACLRDFGGLLEAWPEAWQAARALNA